jgi:hypothetical protein
MMTYTETQHSFIPILETGLGTWSVCSRIETAFCLSQHPEMNARMKPEATGGWTLTQIFTVFYVCEKCLNKMSYAVWRHR